MRKLSSLSVLLVTALLIAASGGGPAGAKEHEKSVTGFINKTIEHNGRVHPYVVYVPPGYDASRAWPVILFLHGAGERGTDGLKQTQVGLGAGIRFYQERYPAISVFPQCLPEQRWSGEMAAMALKTLDATMKEYRCDPDRQYLTGLSMGGYGSWLIASEDPGRFAAVAPICGGGSPQEMASRLTKLPIWVFHGDRDRAVPVGRSREMVQAIKDAGGALIRYTEYPGVEHNSWDATYSNPEFASWLFEQRRRK